MKLLFILLIITPSIAVGQKGLLPEIKIDQTNEEANQKKALQSEIMITRAENAAANALIQIIKKNKGKPNEADLWNRLAELYMRRAKSGRFFDLQRTDTSGALSFAPPEVKEESAVTSLKRAIQVYTKIEREFPYFREMDAVLFNNAFASQQIGLKKNASSLYQKMISKHPRSPLVPDALLALGEMQYDSQKFELALSYFKKMEQYPLSRVYSYGMYKAAWTMYNLRQNHDAIEKLIEVVKYHDPAKQEGRKINHNLRSESLRDLALFFGETHKADEAYSFFAKLTTPDELGDVMMNMAKLYDSHSRQKEMHVFLSDFIKKQSLSKHRVKAHIMLIEGNETLKTREEVIKQLLVANEMCEKDSSWRKANPQSAEDSCDYELNRVNLNIAKKWWEIWQKNKSNKEFSELTRQAFKIHLDREDPAKPDVKSRYAYAELLFQQKDYRGASEEYFKVSNQTQDTTLKHDSDYASLVSLQKAAEIKKQRTDEAELLTLSKRYLERNPKGPHVNEVSFQIGFLAYTNNDHNEAEKWLKPLAENKNSGSLKRKSEDLILDIYNSRKDYVAIKNFSKTLITQSPEKERASNLTKIMLEANYAELQDLVKKGETVTAAEKLALFSKENPDSPLAKDSLWQALSLFNASGRIIQGAELSLVFVKKYPEDKKSLQALKDASKSYLDTGFLTEAADTMHLIAIKDPSSAEKYLEAASEIYILEEKYEDARRTLNKLLIKSAKSDKSRIMGKLLQTFKDDKSNKEYAKLQSKILSENIEPYSSQILLSRVEKLFEQKKYSEAFNEAKPLVGDGADADIKAKARLVQAQILEEEFLQQSTKTSLEKLALVLSIKTEKLDKAQTAYLSAAKIADDANIKLAALQGLNRIYTNYVETVGNAQVKDQMQEEEKSLLASELAKLTAPILQKKIETDEKLKSLAKESSVVDDAEIDFNTLAVDKTYKPRVKNLSAKEIPVFIPKFSDGFKSISELSAKSASKCSKIDFAQSQIPEISDYAGSCFYKKNYSAVEKAAYEMSKKDPSNPMIPYFLSLVAEQKMHFEKSLHLIDLAIKRTPDLSFLRYQKGRILTESKDLASANSEFVKASSLGLKTKETHIIRGVVAFAQGDCWASTEEFSKLDSKTIGQRGLFPVLSECLAQKGEFEKAISYAEENMKKASRPDELWLQVAHVHETYRFDTTKAISAYESALKASSQADMKDWIQRKLDYLKTKRNVTVLNPLHVGSKDSDGGL